MGTGVIFMASQKFMSGELTGNGPTDRQKRQMWLDAGWVPRSIKLGDVWVSYDAIEPFNQILTLIGDVGDNSLLMGEEWTEDQLKKTARMKMTLQMMKIGLNKSNSNFSTFNNSSSNCC